MQQAFTYRLIAELFRSLEAEGYQAGTGQQLRVQELLRRLPDSLSEEELMYALAPLFARNPQQQEQFYRLFQQSYRRTKHYFESLQASAEATASSRQAAKKDAWLKWLIFFLAFALIVPPLAIRGFFIWEDESRLVAKPFIVQGGKEAVSCLADSVIGAEIGQVDTFELRYAGRGDLGSFMLDPPGCLTYIAQDSISGRDSIVLVFKGPLGELPVNFKPNVQQAGVEALPDIAKPKLQAELPSEEPDTAAVQTAGWPLKALPYPHDLYARYSMEDPPSWLQQQLARYQSWLRFGGFLLGYGLLAALLLYRLRRRRVPRLQAAADKPPYAWHLRMEGIENIALGTAFQRLLNRMRARTAGEAYELDVPRTIHATIERAGMAHFQYRRQTRPPEYLLLIDQQSRRNHRARLFDYIFKQFRANEVLIKRYYYDGDPRICYNEQQPEGIPLAELQQRYSTARLFVLGTGQAMVDKLTGKMANWTKVLQGWKQRALFTPKHPDAWGRQERRLAQLFHLLPLSLESLEVLLEALEADEVPSMDNWRKRLEPKLREGIVLDGPLLPTLKAAYRPEMLQWIAACAVFPSLHWHLTLYWGRFFSEGQDKLLSLDNLLELCRLPWFVQGSIPESARLQLVDWLEKEQPQLLKSIRQELHKVLEQHAPPADSAAFEDYRMHAALNEYLLLGGGNRRHQLAEEIAGLMELGGSPDAVAAYQLQQRESRFAQRLPETWRGHLFRQGMPALGMEHLWGELRWVLPALLFFTGVMSIPWNISLNCDGAMVSNASDGGSTFLCFREQAAWPLFLEETALEYLRAAPRQSAMQRVAHTLGLMQGEGTLQFGRDDRIGQQLWRWYLPLSGDELEGEWGRLTAFESRLSLSLSALPDSLELQEEVRANLSVALYNRGATLAEEAELAVQESALHHQACAYFAAALSVDTLFLDAGRLRDWCGGRAGFERKCRVVLQPAVLRSQPINAEKAAEIARAYRENGADAELESGWYLKVLEEGERVEVLEADDNYYWLIADGVPGYLPKELGGDSVLQDCQDRFYELRGRVVDDNTQSSLSNAKVWLDTIAGRTDGDGGFVLSIPRTFPGGVDTIKLWQKGYDTLIRAIYLPAQELGRFSLRPSQEAARAFYSLRASVENLSTGKPVAGARITSKAKGGFQGRSDQSGQVELAVPYRLARGSKGVQLSVSKAGYESREYFVPLADLAKRVTQSFVLRPREELPATKQDSRAVELNIPVQRSRQSRYLWCLDNPHGSNTPGKRSPVFDDGKTQLLEYELSRDLVRRITERLSQLEVDYFEVVPEERDVPLAERVQRIESHPSKQPKMVLSLHFNASASQGNNGWSAEGIRGAEAWPKPDSKSSARLAAICLEYVLRKTSLRNRSIKYSPSRPFYIIENVPEPVVLMQNGFYTNRQEAALLAQPAFRQKLADAYVEAILAIEANGLARTPAPLIEERDSDGDGLENRLDRCPFEPAKGTEDGCPAEARPRSRFEEELLQAPKEWEKRADGVFQQPSNQITTNCPEVGVRGRYAVLRYLFNPQTLERFIGERVFLSGPHGKGMIDLQNKTKFGRYNPAFLKKLQEYLSDAAENEWLARQLQGFYDQEFRDLLREFYDTYDAAADRQFLQQRYLRLLERSAKERKLDDIKQLFDRELQDLLAELSGEAYLVRSMAASFWVRRSIDGTADEFYELLQLAMRTFDPEYLQRNRKRGK